MTDDLIAARKARIKAWLEEDGWVVADTSPTGATWALSANDNRSTVVVGQRGDKPDQIFAQARVDIDSQSAERMASLAEDDRSALLWELRFELLRAGLQFSGISLPMERFQFYQRIFLEDLNRSTLLSLVSNLRRGRLLAQSTLERKLWS